MIKEIILSMDGVLLHRYKNKRTVESILDLMREPKFDQIMDLCYENCYFAFPKQVSLAIGESHSLLQRKVYQMIIFDVNALETDFSSIRRYSFNKPIVYNTIGIFGLKKVATFGVQKLEEAW